jgi:hypothetical protein
MYLGKRRAVALKTVGSLLIIWSLRAAAERRFIESRAREHSRDGFGVNRLAFMRSAGNSQFARARLEVVSRAACYEGNGLNGFDS